MKRDIALALLGLSDGDLDEDTINSAYKTAMRINHPDNYAQNEQLRMHAEEQCKLINEARATLLSQIPTQRKRREEGSPFESNASGNTRSWQWKDDGKTKGQTKATGQTKASEQSKTADQAKSSNQAKTADQAKKTSETDKERTSDTDSKTEDEQKAASAESGETDYFKYAKEYGKNPFGSTYTEANAQPKTPSATPLLDTWKTSVGFSVLGVIAAMAVMEVEYYLNFASYVLLGIAFMVLGVVYAAKLFPTLFTDKPVLKSNNGISFLNFFVTCTPLGVFLGIIFGAIWNYSLTTRELGASRWVFIALQVAMFLWFLWIWFG